VNCRGHHRLRAFWTRLCPEDRAAQIVEFAVALPLLTLFVVGIFDFSGAFTLKQKLTNVARDAARAAAADPVTDLQVNALRVSVSHAFQVINNYFVTSNLNNCGIDQGTITPNAPSWTFKSPTGGTQCPPPGMVIIINRGYYFPADAATATPPDVNCTPQPPGTNMAVVSTCVSIQYAYKWQFGRVASMFGTTTLPTSITATAVAMNEN